MLFDSHCHLDVEEFAADREAVIERARAQGVSGQLLPAIDFASWPLIAELCRRHRDLHAAFGLHPMYLDRHLDAHLDALPAWIERERPCAVGEFGLEFFVDGLDPTRQRELFQRQLRIAREADLPVVLHARRAVEEVIHSLRAIGGLRGVVHSYSGSEEQARQLFDLGFCIGLGGPLTYERAQKLRRVVRAMPLENLLLETDAPDQPDADWRGQRNEPARLRRVAEQVAELRGLELAEVARITSANARRLFGLPPAA